MGMEEEEEEESLLRLEEGEGVWIPSGARRWARWRWEEPTLVMGWAVL